MEFFFFKKVKVKQNIALMLVYCGRGFISTPYNQKLKSFNGNIKNIENPLRITTVLH